MMRSDPKCELCRGTGEVGTITETGFELTMLCDCTDDTEALAHAETQPPPPPLEMST